MEISMAAAVETVVPAGGIAVSEIEIAMVVAIVVPSAGDLSTNTPDSRSDA
jgi:hypothetical protein